MNRYVVALGVLVMSSCDWRGGSNCERLELGTPASELPLDGTGELSPEIFRWSTPLIAGNDELRCCAQNPTDGKPSEATCAMVDCDALRRRLRMGGLKGRFENEPCGPRQGLSICSAVIESDEVVGVYAQCLD